MADVKSTRVKLATWVANRTSLPRHTVEVYCRVFASMMTVSSFDRCSLAMKGFRSTKMLRSCLCFHFLLGISCGSLLVFFVPVVEAWSIPVVPGISLQTAPLIGGPSWLPLHVKMVIFDPESSSLEYDALPSEQQQKEFRFDYVPLNPTSPETLQKLLLLQPVPAEARKSPNVFLKTDTTASLTRHRVQRALDFCETYDKDLQLLSNNCWTFCFELLDHIQRDDDGSETDKNM
jgi:hypothetical protein